MALRKHILRLLPLFLLSMSNLAGADVLDDILERGQHPFRCRGVRAVDNESPRQGN